jgi:DNA (cytosine-5)-methyltransferase 1
VGEIGRKLTVGSLFSGIGGFDLGFERAGFEIKWQVEIDPFCRAVLAKHWPDVRRYEDVRTVGEELERVDVICGGFPCQDISHAGQRAGIDGDRSGLWSEQVRLADELGPDYLLVENVPALLNGGMGRVLGDLAAIGFDAEWDCLPAIAFGAPHRRDRVWILAYPNRSRLERRDGCRVSERAAERLARAGSASLPDANDQGEPGRTFNASARTSLQEFIGRDAGWRTEPDVGRVAHGVPARVDRLRGLGNAIVPQIAEWIARRILEAEGINA